MKMFAISDMPIARDQLVESLANEKAGALVTFEGWVRNHNEGRMVERLEYEAFQPLARAEGEKIIDEAIERYGILAAACVHRVGSLAKGEMAVFVAVTAAHRAEAFSACRYIIDQVKSRLPIWKKEHYVDGTSGWVNCRSCAHAVPAP